MLVAAVLIAVCLLGAGGLLWRRRRPGVPVPAPTGTAPTAPVPAPAGENPADLLGPLSARLFTLAFAAPVDAMPLGTDELAVHESVSRELMADLLQPEHLPRRPSLMPQLLRAMDDPAVAADRLSRIVAHDPVLAADVLKLANSGLYRTAGTPPVESIQRAIVVLGADALRSLLASAMMQPVFRATRRNFPRFPRMLWERTERAARGAELYAQLRHPADRFEAQLAVLLHALGPLAVYGVTLDACARHEITPSASLCLALVTSLSGTAALSIARHWEASPRLIAALSARPDEPLSRVLVLGELLGTLSLLQSQQMLSREDAGDFARRAGVPDEVGDPALEPLVASS